LEAITSTTLPAEVIPAVALIVVAESISAAAEGARLLPAEAENLLGNTGLEQDLGPAATGESGVEVGGSEQWGSVHYRSAR
jgi:hypothetical protein